MPTRLQRQRTATATLDRPAGDRTSQGNTTVQSQTAEEQTAQPTDVQMQRASQMGHSLGDFTIQPALAVGRPGDKYEQEADSVAAQAVAAKQEDGIVQTKAHSQSGATPVQQKPETVQRVSDAGTPDAQLAEEPSLPDIGGGDMAADMGGGDVGGAADLGGGGDTGGSDMAADMGGGGDMAAEPDAAADMLGGEGGALTEAVGADAEGEGSASPNSGGELTQEDQEMAGEVMSPESQDQLGEAVGADESDGEGETATVSPDEDAGDAMQTLEDRILDAIAAGGSAPSEEEQSSLSNYLGIEDPESIEVHDDDESYQLCRDLGALAFTTENHIFFGDGQRGDDELLFHEAWHTVQQGATELDVHPGGDGAKDDDEQPPIVVETEEADAIVAARPDPNAAAGLLVQRDTGEQTEEDKAAEEEQKEQAGAQADNAGEKGGEQGDAAQSGSESAEEDAAAGGQEAVGETSSMTAEIEAPEAPAVPAPTGETPEEMVDIGPSDVTSEEVAADLEGEEIEAEEPDDTPFDYTWVATQPEAIPEWDDELSNHSFFEGIQQGGEPEPADPEVDRDELIGDAIGQGLLSGAVDGGIGAVTAIAVGGGINWLSNSKGMSGAPVINNALATFSVVSGLASGKSWDEAFTGGKFGDDADAVFGAAEGILNAKTPWEAIANYFAGIIGMVNFVTKIVQFIWNLVNMAALICFIVWAVLAAIDALMKVLGPLMVNIGLALISVGNALLPLPFGVGVPPGTSLISIGSTLNTIGINIINYDFGIIEVWKNTIWGFFQTLNNAFLPPLSLALTYLQSLAMFLNLIYMQALILDIKTSSGSVDDLMAKQAALQGATNAMTTNAFAVGTELAAQRQQGKWGGDNGSFGNANKGGFSASDSGGYEANLSFAAGGENAWLGTLVGYGTDETGGSAATKAAYDGFAISDGVLKDDDGNPILDAEGNEQRDEEYYEEWAKRYSDDPDTDQDEGYLAASALYDALEGDEMPEPPMDAPERVDAAAYAMTANEEERVALEAAIEETEQERELLKENQEANEGAQSTVEANREAIAQYQQDIEERRQINQDLALEAGMGTALAAQYLAVMALYWPILIPMNLAFAFVLGIKGMNQAADETKGEDAVNTENAAQGDPNTHASGNAGDMQQAGDNMASTSDVTGDVAEKRIAQLDAADADAAANDAELEAVQAEFQRQQAEAEEDEETLDEVEATAEEELGELDGGQDEFLEDREEAIGEAQDWEEEFSAFYDEIMEELGWSDGEESGSDTSEAASAGSDSNDNDSEDSEGADLSGADLSDTDMTNANLANFDLSDAILVNAILIGANLQDADLSGADLTNADLTDADLSGADLTDADLEGAKLVGADLS